jgi:glycosyltransferase involved in cell wall biosynthesis
MRLLWHQAILPAALRRERASVFYSTVPDGMLSPPCPQVITIHDVLPLRFPAAAPRLKHYFRYVVPRLIEASSAVIAMSEATRQDIQAFYGVDGSRIHVAYQGYRADIFRPAGEEEVGRIRSRYDLGDYLLSVGENRPYKNINRLLKAFARLRAPGLKLVLVGRQSARGTDLRSLAESLGVGRQVVFLGFVSDAELAAVYSGARAFVFPSLYEGFGIPPLEAMACGCPVVSSGTGSMPEVCGNAAVYVDPLDVEDIARGISELLSDPDLRARLRRRGIERAAGFSYRSTALRILEVVRACAA